MSKKRKNEDGSINAEGWISTSIKIKQKDISKIKELGCGSQGVVHLVYTPTIGECVQKTPIINFFGGNSMAEIQELLMSSMKNRNRELKFVSEVDNHPNILAFYGYVVDEKDAITGYLTEYMKNGSLAEVLQNPTTRQRYVSYQRMLDWALQLARALAYCHEVHQVIHRDVKLDNVLLSSDGETIKLCDFGLARVIPAAGQNLTGRVGTLNYMAPEVIDRTDPNYGYPADVWSYGMFLYALSHFKLPFHDHQIINEYTFRRQLEEDNIRPKLDFNLPDVPKIFYQLIPDCWEKIPSNRPKMIQIVNLLHSAKLNE